MHKLIKALPKEQGELVKNIVPAQIPVPGIQRVLQLLLNERVSIRDLATILEGIADARSFTRNPIGIAEHVRTRLARQICAQHTTPAGYLPLIALSAKWEQNFAESIVGTGDDRSLAMHAGTGHLARIRPFVRGIVEPLPRPDQRDVAVGNPFWGSAEDVGSI